MLNSIVLRCMETDASLACGEHRIRYRLVESLHCTPVMNATFCVNYIIL